MTHSTINVDARSDNQRAKHALDAAALCVRVGRSYPTILRWISKGFLPEPRREGREMRWDAAEIDQWIASQPR
jgi:excisionase family DNA binding protein